ncbi:MAG: formate/nitrite transporter family protein [Clostridiales bacterium]|nr:formate/nitrite transporter family protein [Clostridiales bacterium]
MNKPIEIANNYISIANEKTSMAWHKLLILAVLAGAFIALAGALATVAGALSSGSNAAIIKGAVFPLGLMLVVVCGAELFTGNCLLVAPLLNRNIKVKGILKNWGLAYLGNFIGATLIAVLVVYSKTYSGDIGVTAVATVTAKSKLNFGIALLKGILCNMLVCLAVWMAFASKSAAGKMLAVYMPVFAFVVCGFEHSIANMYYIMSAVMVDGGGFNFGYALLNGLLAPTIGNIIGGALLAVAFWALYFKRKENA